MNESNSNEKPKKTITKKRQFYSAPNLPFGEPRVKATDMFFVSPEEIRKYKKEKLADVADDKTKKAKHKGQVKKVNDKNVDKVLLEPFKVTSKNKKVNDDYQWLVKRNIVKLMSAAKKKKNEAVVTTELKKKRAGSDAKKKKSDAGKAVKGEQSKNLAKTELMSPRPRKNPTKKNQIKDAEMKEVRTKMRASTANVRTRNEGLPTQRSQTSPVIHRPQYFTQPRGKTAVILPPRPSSKPEGAKKIKMQKLKDVFDVFKLNETTHENPIVKDELQAIRKKIEEMEPKKLGPVKNKKPIEKPTRPKVVSSIVNLQKRKNKKKVQPNDAPPYVIDVNVKSAGIQQTKSTEQKKKRKHAAPLQTVSA